MKRQIKWIALGFLSVAAFVATPVSTFGLSIGDSITVAETSVNPNQIVQISVTGFYSGGVYAGINQLLINGSQTVNGFCIDPFHFSSSSSLPYAVVDLAIAPKGKAMGALNATYIERLWGSYYSPSMSASAAAGLQIAIWEITGGTSFALTSGNDYGAAGFLAAVQVPNYTGPVADLLGLSGRGQDYVVQGTSSGGTVPDGGTTAMFLGAALCGLAALGRKIRNA